MNILVTGGTGFIGCYFARSLTELGHRLTVLDIHPFADPDLLNNEKIKFVRGDVRDAKCVRTVIEDCDAVLHLAAAHHDFGISETTFQEVNVEAAKVLCDEMTRAGIDDVCFYSTVAIYGTSEPPVTETTPPKPVSDYGKTKLLAENVFEKWVNENETNNCLVIRPTVTFGPGNFANMFTLIRQIDKGLFLPVGSGDNIKSLSYVENIVEATEMLWLRNPEPAERFTAYNYVCKPDLTSGEIAETIFVALGKRAPVFNVPYWLSRLLALPFDAIIKLTGKNLPVSGARIKKLAKAVTLYESTKIRDAGYQQRIMIKEGIEKMVEWYVQEGKHIAVSDITNRRPPAEVLRVPDERPATVVETNS